MQSSKHNISTGGTFARLLAAICCTRPGAGGLVDQFLDVDSLAGGPIDAPCLMPAGSTCHQPVSETISTTAFFR